MEKTSTLPNGHSRRSFLAGAGALGAAALTAGCGNSRNVTPPPVTPNPYSEADILTFALNLEYLEAEFYLRAATGTGLSSADNSGAGTTGSVTGGAKVNFTNSVIGQYAVEIAQNELSHVRLLRNAIGTGVVAAPTIDFTNAFNAAAVAAGVIKQGGTFDPFADQTSFLLGAFIFEDVGVTAYTGAAPALTTKAIISAAAGIQAVEAYHAAEIRTILANLGGTALAAANQIATLRDTLGGTTSSSVETQISIGSLTTPSTIVPVDSNALVFARSADQVLHIVYATPPSGTTPVVKSGGFFPNGLNGKITATVS